MTNHKTLLFIFGTRPEAIKMAPLIVAARKEMGFKTVVCVTAQHREMLDQVLNFFHITPDYDLDVMKQNQDLFDVTTSVLSGLKNVLQEVKPDVVFVQGDTATAFIGALAAFYCKIKVAHIEAGLRSHNKYSPYPEEIYRALVGRLADYHFAPTKRACKHLANENISENVYNVGNTVIDALFLGLEMIKNADQKPYLDCFNFLNFSNKIILITGHRRESFGEPFKNLCRAFALLADQYPDIQFVYPVHLNPNVQEPVRSILGDRKNIFLIDPLDYSKMIWLIEKSFIIITDSGGIQEEAPSLGKPVLVTRDVTERMEGVEEGTAKLVGTSTEVIVMETKLLIESEVAYAKMAYAVNPYGDGASCEQIMEILRMELCPKSL